MSLNDFDSLPDPKEELEGGVNEGNVTQVDVAKLLKAKETMEKAIDATNDAAAQVGYEIGVAAEKSRVLEVIKVFREQDFMNDNGKALLDALAATLKQEDAMEESESENE
jgi:hypothetical protein